MLVAFLIMLREGIEAALVVGIVASYLAQTGRRDWMPFVWGGVVGAALICLAIGIALDRSGAEFPQKQQELFEGIVAVLAVGMLTSMVFWMRRAARSIKSSLQQSVDDAFRSKRSQGFALALVAFLAVGREGLESVFFLLATVQQDVGPGVPVGAALGVVCAILVGAGIYRGGVRLDLRRFFRWTGLFIIFVAAGLLAGGLRAFHEAGIWNGLQEVAFDLGDVLPVDSTLGTLLAGIFGYQDAPTVGEVGIYVLFLVPALLLFFAPPSPARPTVARAA